MTLVVAGYYGCGNLGDDALLLGLLNGLGGRHEVLALSGNPEATRRAFGVGALPRKDLREVTNAIRRSDALVFGGGGLLQDTTSLLSLKYYTHLIDAAARSGKRVALLGQGIGPIRSALGKRAAARAFAQCHLITTRDEGSMRLVERLSPQGRASRAVTDDLAWLACKENNAKQPSKTIAVSARPWKNQTAKVIAAFRGFCERARSKGWQIVPVSFDRGMDDVVLEQIAPGGTFVDSPQELLAVLGSVERTLAMRLHAGIFSTALGIAPTMVSYDDKVTAFADSLGSRAVPVAEATTETLWSAFEKTVPADEVLRRRDLGIARARINITMLEEMLRSVNTG